MYKYQFQIVGAQQFEYIMQEGEFASPSEAVAAYKELQKAYKGESGPGLPPKEFNFWLDNYLKNQTGDANQYNKMSQVQKDQIQELKKAFKRLNVDEHDN